MKDARVVSRNIVYCSCLLDCSKGSNRHHKVEETVRGGYKLWRIIILSGLLCLPYYSPGYSQAALPTIEDQMIQLEEEIWNSLDNLKHNSTNLIEELEELRRLQKVSQVTLTELESSLENTLDRYNDCAQQLQNTRVDLQKRQTQVRKLRTTLAIIFILFIIVRVVTIVLKLKFGIQLPYILNAIL